MPPPTSLLLLAALLPVAVLAANNDWKTGEVTGKVVEKSDFPCYSLSRDNYTCSACIQFHESCAWCGSPVSQFELYFNAGILNFQLFDEKKPYARCDSREKLLEHGCPTQYIEDPITTLEVTEDVTLSDQGKIENEAEAVQLKPQMMNVEIRPSE